MKTKASVYSLEGKVLKEVELPSVFEEEYNPELIKRAVLSIQSARVQPQGTYTNAGRDYTARYRGMRRLGNMHRTINVGVARKPRLKNRRYLLQGNVATIPGTVGGPRAHPIKTEKTIAEKINKKEKAKATASALAATLNIKLVSKKHIIPKDMKLPLIIEDKFEGLNKTREVVKTLTLLRIYEDVLHAKDKKKIRSGHGKLRGRKYKRKKSLLIVISKPSNVYKAARNLEGVEIKEAKQLNAELLAPGCQAGRLTVFTESSLKELK